MILPAVILGILVLLKELLCRFDSMDEVYVYTLSRAVATGMVPYRDFNMVMPPLFFHFLALPLLLSRTVLMMRIVNSIFLTFMMLLIYRICRQKTGDEAALLLSIAGIAALDIATYNTMFCVFAMIAYILLSRIESGRYVFILGIVTTLSALSRQTSGTLLLIACLVIVGILTPKGKKFKNIIVYLLGVGLICTIFLIYLLATGSFSQFWEYCLFAVLFTDGNSTIAASGIPGVVITILGVIADIKLYRKDSNKEHIFHIVTGVLIFTAAIPIVDLMHTSYAGIWFMIPLFEVFVPHLAKMMNKRMWIYLDVAASVICLIFTFFSFRGAVFTNDVRELKYVPLSSSFEAYKDIAYINTLYQEQGYDVVTISNEAALISLINEEYNPPYDLFLKGNLGMTDPMVYVEEACSSPNTVILITDDYQESCWEAPEGVYDYVTSHCHPVNSYAQFVWYLPD